MKTVKPQVENEDVVYPSDISLDEDLVFFRKGDLIYVLRNDIEYYWSTNNDHNIFKGLGYGSLQEAIFDPYEMGANIKCISSSEVKGFNYG